MSGSVLPPEYGAEFEAERRRSIASANWVVNWIGFLLYPITTFLDLIQFPATYGRLSAVRFGATAGLGLLLVVQWVLRRSGLAVPLNRVVMWAVVGIVIVHLDVVNVMVGGPETTYYAGITLLLLCVLVAFPLSLKEMGLTVVLISLQYNIVMLLFDPHLEPDGFLNANYFFFATAFIGLFATALGNRLRIDEFLARKRIESEKARSDQLLLNILPEEVAEELKTTGRVHARHIRSCSILFTDFVGFTRLANRAAPEDLVRSLDRAFSRFDQIVDRWGLEKLKTIGDGYMAAGGVLEDQPDHLLRSILAGLEMMHAIEDEGLGAADGTPWRVRIGVHPGPVVAGVIGQKKFAFDLWGDTVNTASRLEAQGHPRTINLATKVYKAIEPFFDGVDRGYVPVRGKGPMAMTGITRLRPKYSEDPEGRVPNEMFRQDARRWLDGLVEPVVGPAADPTAAATRVELQPGPADPLAVLSELTPDDKQALMELAEPVSFRPGQVIVEQGQSLAVLLMIIRGSAAVRVAQEGVSVEVGQVRPGEVVGEMSFVSWEPASATVVALDEVVALRFEMEWMESLISRHPRTGVRLFHSLAGILAQRVRETT
ncbi:MAG: cyclic nucleotide-binding domain-containing protein, partial [Deltaproteobacteria bacterium]|nr:cyclic nucleotide-binding domain-containing protein [Deltaproteobacteria bacterium]